MAHLQIIWSGMSTLEDTVLAFDLCYVQWAWDGTRTYCSPEALVALYTRCSEHSGYLSHHVKYRLEKAQSKGFHVDIDWSTNPVRPREWWHRYPFPKESSGDHAFYSLTDSSSDGQRRRYSTMCDGFRPIHEVPRSLNLHGHLLVGGVEFDPYSCYHRYNPMTHIVLVSFCLDLVRVSKVLYNYVYCQVDLKTFEKIYSEHLPARMRLLDDPHWDVFTQSMDLNCLDDEGNLVLPLYVQNTKIRHSKSPIDTTDIFAEERDAASGRVTTLIHEQLSTWIHAGDYISVTVCAREMRGRVRLHAVNIWIYSQSSEIVQSLVRLSQLRIPNMLHFPRDGMCDHPLCEMAVPTKEVKDKFYDLISSRPSVFTQVSRPRYAELDMMAYRGLRMQVTPWVPYGSSTPTCAYPHWYFNVLKCWSKILGEFHGNLVRNRILMLRRNDNVNANGIGIFVEKLDGFLTTQTRATIDFDDFKNVFEATFQ